MESVTFSYMQIKTGLELDPPKIWDSYPGTDKLVHGTKLKHNYKTITIPWDNMFRMVQSGYRAISQAITKTGRMTDNPDHDEFVSMEMILLDFDEGFKLDEMKLRFKNYTHLVHTSRNHMKDKQGKGVAERFRVILPLGSAYTDKSDLKLAMKFLVQELYKDYGIDEKCTDLTRIMFTGGIDCEYFYNDGIKYPMGEIIALAKEWEEKRRAAYKEKRAVKTHSYTSTPNGTKADWYRKNLNTPLVYKALRYEEKAASGRNNALYAVGIYLLEDVGLTADEVTTTIYYVNSQYADPLGEKEIESTVLRSLRIGGRQ